MWWIATAHAELPWDCPTVTTPAEASPYRRSDAGAAEALDGLEALAMAYWDEGCAWEYTSEDDGYTEAMTATCETDAYTFRSSRRIYADYYGASESTTLEVSVPEGEAWTSITLSTDGWEWASSGMTYGFESTRVATWAGAPDGYPADGSLTLSTSSSQGDAPADSVLVESPTCTMRWGNTGVDTTQEYEGVGFTPGGSVGVSRFFDPLVCDAFDPVATVDGVVWGAVHDEDWTDDPADGDRDGYTGTCDCDDADPARNVYAVETADDGIDQDCDGSDRVTEDTGDTAPPEDTGDPADIAEDPGEDTEGCVTGAGTPTGLAWIGAAALAWRARRRSAVSPA